MNVALPEGRFIRDFPGYIFYTEKNNRGKLENVMIFRLENETNVTTTIRAPSGEIMLDTTNKQIIVNLFDARLITLKSSGKPALTSVGKLPFAFDLKFQRTGFQNPKSAT